MLVLTLVLELIQFLILFQNYLECLGFLLLSSQYFLFQFLFLIQFLADLLGKPVSLIGMPDVSALGAAYMAGLKAGVYEDFAQLKKFSTATREVKPENNQIVETGYKGWTVTIKNHNAT